MRKQIFLLAAERIADERDEFACHAIDKAADTYPLDHCPERSAFTDMFKPTDEEAKRYGVGNAAWLGPEYGPSTKEDRNDRVVALCFAAEAIA